MIWTSLSFGPSHGRAEWSASYNRGVPTENDIRNALVGHVVGTLKTPHAIGEFWLPRSNGRADLVMLDRLMWGYEIKTERDTLRRLPNQIMAYERLFDRCTVVLAGRHVEPAMELLPLWWGVSRIGVNGSIAFERLRAPKSNPNVDAEVLVRLLWRGEVEAAVRSVTGEPDPRASRVELWRTLVEGTSLDELKRIVRHSLIKRDPSAARIPTRRFRPSAP